MTNNDTFAKRLIQRRAQLEYSQEELSKRTGIAAAQISRYEAGINKPRANIISKLANHLGVPFSWLAYGEETDLSDEDKGKKEIGVYLNLPKEKYDLIMDQANKLNMNIQTYLHRVVIPNYLAQKEADADKAKK
ncbi:helix-turn-helix transcriptional regulator [Frischella sp. Ac48]|uniref:helix-turn-helix domain-containing protein n=1 Tax=Frischella sp. Ac48 TaxID=2804531 RepID=UPI001C7CCA70|nr:helix-turn-helix transcriptional regulator [Frischella sp. Ac48]MBX4133442.1 helix-turn-helix transcriptional regulator [Frischella sp. Ac48]